MSMRARISLAVGGVILATLLLFSLVVVRSVRATLIDQVDSQVSDVSKRMTDKKGPKPDSGPEPGPSATPDVCYAPSVTPSACSYQDDHTATPPANDDSETTVPLPQETARFVFSPTGEMIIYDPAGYRDDPESSPSLPAIPSKELNAMVGHIVTVDSEDGTIRYRVLVKHLDNGNYDVTAGSLKNADATVNDMVRLLIVVGSGAVIAASLAAGGLIRRGLRPVDRMVQTATAIAAGDLSQRVPDPDPRTELGQLGGALNQMLAQVEQSVQVRTESETRMRRFVADAAHELRTPLTSLRGYAELYRQGALPTPDAVSHAMGRIESEGSRMARLVEDLLLLARLDQHRALERAPVDLSTLVTDAVSDFRVANPQRIVSASIQPRLTITGDALRIRQVLDNLLANAQAHTPITASIDVILQQLSDQVRLTVSDTGPGISPEDQSKIFERFWRADPGRTRRSGGSGLGLSISASLTAAMDGTIDVSSELGRGTTFTVTFPIRSASASDSEDATTLDT